MNGSLSRKQGIGRALAVLLTVAALLASVYEIVRLDTAPRTDDAYAYADTVNVAPEVSGRLVELAVRDNQLVRKGDLLFRVDPRPFQDALEKANASLYALDQEILLARRNIRAQQLGADAARANVERARAVAEQSGETLQRLEPLLPDGYVAAEQVDQARTAQRSAVAQLEAARLEADRATAAVTGVEALQARRTVIRADIAQARLNLEYATVRAPFDGRVINLRTAVGQYVAAGHALFTLADTQNWYVIANFRETELGQVHPGMAAELYLMSDTSRRFSGVVESIGYGVFPDDAGATQEGLPRVPRSINWVRVAQRFPVRIQVDHPDLALFRVGASAVASLLSNGAAGAGHSR